MLWLALARSLVPARVQLDLIPFIAQEQGWKPRDASEPAQYFQEVDVMMPHEIGSKVDDSRVVDAPTPAEEAAAEAAAAAAAAEEAKK